MRSPSIHTHTERNTLTHLCGGEGELFETMYLAFTQVNSSLFICIRGTYVLEVQDWRCYAKNWALLAVEWVSPHSSFIQRAPGMGGLFFFCFFLNCHFFFCIYTVPDDVVQFNHIKDWFKLSLNSAQVIFFLRVVHIFWLLFFVFLFFFVISNVFIYKEVCKKNRTCTFVYKRKKNFIS